MDPLEPKNRVRHHSRSPQNQEDTRRQGPQTPQRKKNTAKKQPCTLQKAKTYKHMDSDEDDDEPQNEPGTSPYVRQLYKQVLLFRQGPEASSQGPGASLQGRAASANSGDEDSEYSDEYNAQSQDSGTTLLDPDLYVLINDEHWKMTPETHKNAAAARSFCFVTTENGDQQDICNMITMPCKQRSSYLNAMTNNFSNLQDEVRKGVGGRTRDMLEHYMTTCGKVAGIKAKRRSRARKEATAEEVRGYYKQFAEAKQLEYKSWVHNEVFRSC